MAAIAAYVPFILLWTLNGYNLYYSSVSDIFATYIIPTEGYKNHTLYAEAETRFFSTTNSNGSNLMDDDLYIHLEEAKIFLTIDGIKKYFKVNTTIELVQTTTDINEASIFTLNTTPEDHKVGNFFIQYTTSDQENTSLESFTTYDLIMKLTDRTIGPYHLALCKHGDSCNGIYFDLLGHGSSLPRFNPQ